jgi:hypothetical protein
MPEHIQPSREEVPPPGEAVHLPEPSYLPVIVGLGVSIAVVGIVITWPLVVIGVLITLVAVVRWIRETRQEMGELPLEH